MTRGMTPEFATALAERLVRPVVFFEGAFASGTLRLWTGLGDIQWNDQTWVGAGSLLGVGSIEEGDEVQAYGTSVSLSGVPLDLVQLCIEDARQGLPGKVWVGLLSEDAVGEVAASETPYAASASKADLQVPPGGLMLDVPFSGAIGSTAAADQSGIGHPVTFAGGAALSGAGEGVNTGPGWAEVAYSNLLVPTGDFAIFFDVYFEQTGNDLVILSTQKQNAGGFRVATKWNSGAELAYVANDTTRGANYVETAGAALQAGQWYAVAVRNASGTVTITIDGVQRASRAVPNLLPTDVPLSVGRDPLNGNVLTGRVRDVRIVNGATELPDPPAESGAAPGRLIGDPILAAAGRLDVPNFEDSADSCTITITYEGRLIGLTQPLEWRYTDECQRLLYPGDRAFEYVTTIQDKDIQWGTK